MSNNVMGPLALLAVVSVFLWIKERRARAYPAVRRASYRGRIRQADNPEQRVTAAADYLAANLRHVRDTSEAWAVARVHADALTAAADELDHYVPRKEARR